MSSNASSAALPRLVLAVIAHPIRVLLVWLAAVVAVVAFAGSGVVPGGRPLSAGDVTWQLTMVAIALMLLMLFRSVVATVLDGVLVFVVGAATTGLMFLAARLLGFPLDTSVTTLLPIVVLGVAAGSAMRCAIVRVGPAIGLFALIACVSLSALALASLTSLKALEPPLGFGMLPMLAAALTLAPGVAVSLRGSRFWPARERVQAGADRAEPVRAGRAMRAAAPPARADLGPVITAMRGVSARASDTRGPRAPGDGPPAPGASRVCRRCW
jgi:MMPL family